MLEVINQMGSLGRYLSFGVIVVAITVGLFLWWKYGVDDNYEEEELFDSVFMLAFWFVVFARLGYVIVNYRQLSGAGAYFSLFSAPGFNYLTGWMGVIGAIILIAKSNEWDVWKILDLFSLCASGVIAISYLGLFIRGANPGMSVARFGVLYPGSEVGVIPVDLIGALWFGVTFFVVRKIRKNFRFYSWYKYNSTVARDGLAFLSFVIIVGLYYLVRSFIDGKKVLVLGYPWMGMWAVGLIVVAGVLIYFRSGRSVMGDFTRMFTPKEARFSDPGLRRKASLLKLRRKIRDED